MAEAPDPRGPAGAKTAPATRSRSRVETSAGGVVFRRNEDDLHFLLIRDPYHNWGLPKGHLEGSEAPRDAALREVREETGLSDLHLHRELATIDWFYRDKQRLVHKYCHFFLIESPTGEPTPQRDEGISACVWLPLGEALDLVTYDNAREVLRAAGDSLQSGDSPAQGGTPLAGPEGPEPGAGAG